MRNPRISGRRSSSTGPVMNRMASSEPGPSSCSSSSSSSSATNGVLDRPVASAMAAGSPVHTTLTVDVTGSDGLLADASPPSASPETHSLIRRSLSPLLDFSRGADRRNFCTITECSYCKPLTDNHRLSPLRSPVISPSSTSSPPGLSSVQFNYSFEVASQQRESRPTTLIYFSLTYLTHKKANACYFLRN